MLLAEGSMVTARAEAPSTAEADPPENTAEFAKYAVIVKEVCCLKRLHAGCRRAAAACLGYGQCLALALL